VHEGHDGRRHEVSALREHLALDFLEARRGEAGQADGAEAVGIALLLRTTYDIAAAQVAPVVCKRGQGFHHVVDVGDVLFPLHALALAPRKVPQVDLVRRHRGSSPQHMPPSALFYAIATRKPSGPTATWMLCCVVLVPYTARKYGASSKVASGPYKPDRAAGQSMAPVFACWNTSTME
jgi:hypothetical protein